MIEHIPTGRAHATSIPALSLAIGLSDRAVREEIARLVNEEHVPIVTAPTPGGSVYLATTPEELDHVIQTARSRAMANLRRARAYRLCREALAWSPELFPRERGHA
jgi:hypothetical protein